MEFKRSERNDRSVRCVGQAGSGNGLIGLRERDRPGHLSRCAGALTVSGNAKRISFRRVCGAARGGKGRADPAFAFRRAAIRPVDTHASLIYSGLARRFSTVRGGNTSGKCARVPAGFIMANVPRVQARARARTYARLHTDTRECARAITYEPAGSLPSRPSPAVPLASAPTPPLLLRDLRADRESVHIITGGKARAIINLGITPQTYMRTSAASAGHSRGEGKVSVSSTPRRGGRGGKRRGELALETACSIRNWRIVVRAV